MRKNMGSPDRIIRLLIVVLIAVLTFTGVISGTLGLILGIIAVILFATSLLGFCPIYYPFHISTRKKS